MPDRKLVPLQAQAYESVLYVDLSAPSEHLYEVAERRLNALEDLLRVLEVHEGHDVLVHETARVASALVPLVGEARQLYELARRRALEAPAGA
ncbi:MULTISPECIES: hypothetical protein [Pseudomonas]|uniref:hypothetical protein n=1 Tax=Pseudomonas TaxID=286 RepID=UPI000D6F6C9B|nr:MULTISPECIES: hypothetical protein [unclassified Pseudomonas]MED5610033.1 hypothetical protein [Pseudomonas sp. JH-2]PWU26422.1 hypothetical protein DK254_28035 [Pseudomonas sp. RW407]